MLKQKGQCQNLPPSVRSLVATLASPLPLVSQRFPLMASRLAALPCALCVFVLPTPSVNLTARSEGFVSASAQQDRMMKTLVFAVQPVLVAEAQCRALRSVQFPLRLGLHSNAFSNRTDILLCAVPNPHSHCSKALHQALPRSWSSSPHVHVQMGPWSCFVTIVAFKFSAPPLRKSSHFLQLTDHESFFRWHVVQRCRFLDSILCENDVLVCHWHIAKPDTTAPSLIQIACWHGCVLVHHSFSEWQHLDRSCFPKNHAQMQFSHRFSLKISSGTMLWSNQPRYQDAVAW